ncbi:MAG: hypothetical protein JWO32_23 [Bacteroidetes bacterium]|nr:hypothetical protein [Bacteroidota bacterium]
MLRKGLLIVMVVLYILAGCNHFINSEFYLKIMPSYIPYHFVLIVASGIIEIILGILLIFNKTRSVAAWLIIAMLVAFMPVHIQMMKDAQPTLFISIARFFLQFVLIYWAYTYTRNGTITRAHTPA